MPQNVDNNNTSISQLSHR